MSPLEVIAGDQEGVQIGVRRITPQGKRVDRGSCVQVTNPGILGRNDGQRDGGVFVGQRGSDERLAQEAETRLENLHRPYARRPGGTRSDS